MKKMFYVMISRPAGFKAWLAFLLLAMLLVSCSSGSSSDGSGGNTPDNLYAGVTECYLCHSPDDAIARFAGMDIVEKWLKGPHGNDESISQVFQKYDDHPNNTGFPYYGFGGLGESPDCTLVCHDQLSDGELLEDFWAETRIEYLGIVNRPIVACESCHGYGIEHKNSVGLISPQYARPDADRCGQCHNSDFDHNEHHPEGDNIYEDYISSPHADSIKNPNYVIYGNPASGVKALCSKCHTDEGAKLYKDVHGGHDELEAALDGEPPLQEAAVVQCRTCHNSHDPHELLFEESGGKSAEYLTCSNCHQNDGSFGLADAYHGENSSYSWDDEIPPLFDSEGIIYDTHFDNPATSGIEGYNFGPLTDGNSGLASERLCRDCHNVHAADTTINNQWARSGHAGHIAEVKEAADASDPQNILDAAVEGSPFDFFDFSTFSSGICSRCHTATGAKNYLSDPDNYSRFDNDFSHLSGEQKELMYCWACHDNNSGELRAPGPITADYENASYTYPDIRGTNVCMACHVGRESGDGIKNSADDFSDKGFVDSHYLSAGGTLYTATGYEFDSRDYSNAIYYVHDRVGLANPVETGDNGPCIGCHMKTEEGHLFMAVEKDPGGDVTELTTFEETCSDCHAAEQELMDQVNALHEGFEAALEALRIELAVNGYVFLGFFPYFNNTDWISASDPTGKNNMGSAFNYSLLIHEPGAYVHNSLYTKRLIFDSIDWLDNGSLDGIIDLTGYDEAAAYLNSKDLVGAVTRP